MNVHPLHPLEPGGPGARGGQLESPSQWVAKPFLSQTLALGSDHLLHPEPDPFCLQDLGLPSHPPKVDS